MQNIDRIREQIKNAHLTNEKQLITQIIDSIESSSFKPSNSNKVATSLIDEIRNDKKTSILELFLAEYGLSNDEGIALMCLAEALLRIPDDTNIDAIIDDKISESNWISHMGNSDSRLVNTSTLGLSITGAILSENKSFSSLFKNLINRLGKPFIRSAVKAAMKQLGNQFVLGETIESAVSRGYKKSILGYTFSYDMLGEAALTKDDADTFYKSYLASIKYLASQSKSDSVRENPGISIKLSALHPRYEVSQKDRVLSELVTKTLNLAIQAKTANLGFNIDAEESERLDLSLDIIEKVLQSPQLEGWSGFGVVVQAYSKRSSLVIDWLNSIATKFNRKIMVRLVKGAYWDSEIKRAQVEGLKDYPVFTNKSSTDCSYIHCAIKLLAASDRLYPQFATHNANTIAEILEIAGDSKQYEFQRLHGMGENLHRIVKERKNIRCRIYAPVGPHKDLLAYLVRRLLENGANSSFVNQIVDKSLSTSKIASNPIAQAKKLLEENITSVKIPSELYGEGRINSKGWDLHDELDIALIDNARNKYLNHQWEISPITHTNIHSDNISDITNPADPNDKLGTVIKVKKAHMSGIIDDAKVWLNDASTRSNILQKSANLFEKNYGELFTVLTREAGKTPADAISELREAVDFLRYYAVEALKLNDKNPCGVIACISPWNFPLAIFTGQISAALAAGNGVIAKPADQTPIIAWLAVKMLQRAGVPTNVLQFVPGRGSVIGSELTTNSNIKGMCFTGSTDTAMVINKNMSMQLDPSSPLIAETGGLNAMVVDSTALPEQVIKDVLASAFQSAGQRCSALRMLYIQEDISEGLEKMLFDAMDELVIGNPWLYNTDVGPVIDEPSYLEIADYIETAKLSGRVIKQLDAPSIGNFIGPAVIRVTSINELEKEVFGPVLHIATFKATELDQVIKQINSTGYGLTFGIHTRIGNRVEKVCKSISSGNTYVNRNQIGAIVGSQPFGGEGLSGTGPKAGGPNYLKRFTRGKTLQQDVDISRYIPPAIVQEVINDIRKTYKREMLTNVELPGPTGEKNTLYYYSRGIILCLGPTYSDATQQAKIAKDNGCLGLVITPGGSKENEFDGFLDRESLTALEGFHGVACWSTEDDLRAIKIALSLRNGPIIPLITEQESMKERCILERHVCIDTTAAGGNTDLLSSIR